jgi:hypothetical protein
MDYLENYEQTDLFPKPNESISEKKIPVDFDDSEKLAEHLGNLLGRIFLATHRRKIDKALDELKIDM